MTKIEVFVTSIGVIVGTLLLMVLFKVGRPGAGQPLPAASEQTTAQSLALTPPPDSPSNPPLEPTEASPNPAEAKAILALVNGSDPVPDYALLRLAGMVNIGNALNVPPDKQAWQEVLPVARQLLTFPCDCGQRNWLSHFIEMGDCALAGSQDDYLESAKLMQILGRNDAQEAEAAAKLAGQR